jgi:SagB-type dehydrogenase family enzyme
VVVSWTYALPPDVAVEPNLGGAFLHTVANRMWIEPAEFELIRGLASGGRSETELLPSEQLIESDPNAVTRGAALLFRLDRAGLLARCLISGGHRLATCVPLRPPPGPPPESPPPETRVRLSPLAIARTEPNAVGLEAPGAWARITLHDRRLLPLLHDLSVQRPVSELTKAVAGHAEDAIRALLMLMSWCDLLDRGAPGWSAHDLLFHTRTRAGYARALRGKVGADSDPGAEPDATISADGTRRVPLEPPDLGRLLSEDPPHAVVSERRRSIRRPGSTPPTAAQLSEFLFRTLHERNGRRPYPSGGACYPLKAYVAVHRCLGVAPGLYAYDPVRHDLSTVSAAGPALDRLLAEAAGAAAVELPPQILIVLAAQFVRTQRIYPDIGYNLILKEVGAVFQAAMLAAAAMGLGACPLGCGNALLFSELAGMDPLIESSMGELMLGSLADTS